MGSIHQYVAEQIIGVSNNDERSQYIRLQLLLKDPLLAMDDARETTLQALLNKTDEYLDSGKRKVRKILRQVVAIVTKKSRKIIQGAGVSLINADQKIRFQAFCLYQFDKYLLHFRIVGE